MSIFKKGNNWYIDYYLKGRRKRKKIGHSKKLAEQVLKNVQVKIVKKEYLGILEEQKVLFDEYGEQYRDYAKVNKALSTYERRDKINIDHLTSFFKGKYLFEIDAQMIENFKATRLEKVAPATVNRELACLKHMYTKALEWGLVKESPAKAVKLLKEPPGRLRYLMPEEVHRLLGFCAKHIKPIVVTAVNTGMRKSEILNLRWSEVDLKNRKIMVTNTKNNESRVIPINRTLYQELLMMPRSKGKEYVFSAGNRLPFGDVKKGFSAAVKKAEIKDFRFHDLRHTFGSHKMMQGVNLKTVQQVLGHKDIKMTMRYSHLSPEYVQDAMERLDTLWTPYGHQGEIKEKENSCNVLN